MEHYLHILILLFAVVLISSITVPIEPFLKQKRYPGKDKVSCLHGSDKETCDLYKELNQTGSQALADGAMDGEVDESALTVPKH
jgi:hypothetical protein